MTAQARFEALQARWRKANESANELAYQLKRHYGETYLAPSGKRDKLDKARARESAASDAIFTWLDSNSPRDWRHGVPYHFACDTLTYADAITSGQLSVVPPCCFGGSPWDSRAFAAPVQSGRVIA